MECNIITPDLAKTSNVKNCTRMASKSGKLHNLDFQAEFPQAMPHNNNDSFLLTKDDDLTNY